MSMKTSCWLFNPEWTGIFGADEMKGFNTSRWRPHGQCATWEETFHTITEGYNKLAAINPDGPYRNWLYTKGSVLGSIMDEDIRNESYNTEEQNKSEKGNYDFQTAVNEYLNQIWMANFSGHRNLLNHYQQSALNVMIETKGFPF